jgi:putative transposase
MTIVVNAANKHDSKMAFEVIELLKYRFEIMEKIYADGGYRGELAENVKKKFGWNMEITLHSDKSTEFKTFD